MSSAICLRDVSVNFGGIQALQSLSCEIPEGQLHGVIGPNGSGKTTFLNVIARFQDISGGTIELFGKDITRAPSHRVSAHGVVRTFQQSSLINDLTVLENVMLGSSVQRPESLMDIALRTSRYRTQERKIKEKALEMIHFVGIEFLADRKGDQLAGGQMRLVEIARALASDPKLLLLDEPAAGLSLVRIDAVKELISRINREMNVTIILVEHVLSLISALCEEVSVLVSGEFIVSGTPQTIQKDPKVREAYLGGSVIQ